MSTSPSRRLKRMQDRTAKKLYNKIAKETIQQIMKQPQKEREEMMMLYKHLNEQKQNAGELTQEEMDWFNNIDIVKPLKDG